MPFRFLMINNLHVTNLLWEFRLEIGPLCFESEVVSNHKNNKELMIF